MILKTTQKKRGQSSEKDYDFLQSLSNSVLHPLFPVASFKLLSFSCLCNVLTKRHTSLNSYWPIKFSCKLHATCWNKLQGLLLTAYIQTSVLYNINSLPWWDPHFFWFLYILFFSEKLHVMATVHKSQESDSTEATACRHHHWIQIPIDCKIYSYFMCKKKLSIKLVYSTNLPWEMFKVCKGQLGGESV